MTRHFLSLTLFVLSASIPCFAADAVKPADPERKWLQATAYAIPKETATEGEGYFSIIEGPNRRLYIGTHANGVNSWLVEFDEESKKMKPVVDAMKEIGSNAKGFAAQAKIHTRNNVGASGKIYFGTKQGYPGKDEKGGVRVWTVDGDKPATKEGQGKTWTFVESESKSSTSKATAGPSLEGFHSSFDMLLTAKVEGPRSYSTHCASGFPKVRVGSSFKIPS